MNKIEKKTRKVNFDEKCNSNISVSRDGRLCQQFPMKILVAEDNLINRKLVTTLLSSMGFKVNSVINGLEAYEMVKRMDFDIVLMDIQMPEMSGIEATLKIREEVPVERQPLIIALTANVLAEDKETCIKSGMVDYMTKPVNFNLLHEMLIKWGNYLCKKNKQ